MAQHTPGPWRAEGWEGVVVNAADGSTLVLCPNGKDSTLAEIKANAKLIAAAPDLLDLLALALPYVEEAELDPGYKARAVKNLSTRIRQAIEAIDK